MGKQVKPAKPKKATRADKVKSNGKAKGVAKRAKAVPVKGAADSAVLDRLYDVVMSRRTADPAISHSARLLSRGTAKVAQKFGEEAVECLIDAVAGNHDAVVAESADVLYHLIVLWVASGVAPDEVWTELTRREGMSGIAEKASRPRDLPVAIGPRTTKIP